MKELSIEEKAKRYDEALARAREIHSEIKAQCHNIMAEVFPELKESEDEKIRKWLIGYFQQYKSDGIEKYANGLKVDNIIAWLEKQGEKSQEKPILEIWKSMRLEIYQQASGNRHEPNYSDDNTKIFSLNDIDEIIEKINEQKPADMVELKFKVGDWVVFKNRHQSIYQVEKIEDGYYVLRHTHGGTFRVLHEESLRLWTIQDAEDGDVLLFEGYYNSIVLFQGIGINGIGRINYHCQCFLSNYSIGIQGDIACLGTVEKDAQNYHPATKEQRDLLFQKMKEEGYEWDAEKKELKSK